MTAVHRTGWDDATVAQLRQMVAAGETASRIAAALGCTRNAVIGKVSRLGLQLGNGLRTPSAPGVVRRVPERPAPIRPLPPRPVAHAHNRRHPSAPSGEPAALRALAHREAAMAAAPAGAGVTLEALDAAFRLCRWVMWRDPARAGGDLYCGERAAPGCSWCATHRARVFDSAGTAAALARAGSRGGHQREGRP